MTFKSEKQRKFMHANHPEIAKRWEKDYKKGGRVKLSKGTYIGPSIRGEYGGVNLSTIAEVYRTGVNVTIVGSGLFNAENVSTRFQDLLNA